MTDRGLVAFYATLEYLRNDVDREVLEAIAEVFADKYRRTAEERGDIVATANDIIYHRLRVDQLYDYAASPADPEHHGRSVEGRGI